MLLPKKPFSAVLLERTLLSRYESENSVYRLRFSCPTDQGFEPGDVAYVCVENHPEKVEQILSRLQIEPTASVRNEEGKIFSIEEALRSQYEFQWRANVDEETNRSASSDFLDHLVFLREKTKDFCAQTVLSWLRPMRPRGYSIASARIAHPGELELMVKLVTFLHPTQKTCHGLSSGFLCKQLAVGEAVPMYWIASKFHLPVNPNLPIILIGPGTGLAPFRAFLEVRKMQRIQGKTWLFFGGRNAENDFLFQDWLELLQKENILSHFDLAWSRDQAYKIYVQDRMREHAKELWDWVQQGASIYVCGDARQMEKDVYATWLSIFQQEGKLSEEAARAYFKQLEATGRYNRDVY